MRAVQGLQLDTHSLSARGRWGIQVHTMFAVTVDLPDAVGAEQADRAHARACTVSVQPCHSSSQGGSSRECVTGRWACGGACRILLANINVAWQNYAGKAGRWKRGQHSIQ